MLIPAELPAAQRASERAEDRWAALEDWGRAPAMSPLEAVMWRGDRHPEFSSSGIVLEMFDRAPDWDRFRAGHEWATRLVPRLRQSVLDPALPLGPPVWRPDPWFDLDYHLRRVRLPAPGGMRELLDLAQAIALRPLDRARPLWVGTLVEGLEDGRAAYLVHAHHCLMDGAGLIQLLSSLHSPRREPTPEKPHREPTPGKPHP